MERTYRAASGRTMADLLTQYTEDRIVPALGTALYREGEGIMTASKPLVPVDTGSLRASGYVDPPEREGETITVELGYGGPAAHLNPKTGESTDGYALIVHEDLNAFHKVGSAKYLSLPFYQALAGMSGRVVASVRSILGGGG